MNDVQPRTKIGDVSAAFVSTSVLIYAVTRGLPKILLARMALNILINELAGIVPVLGSAFAFWFRANKRNYDLLQRHLELPSRPRKSDWVFVGAVLGSGGLESMLFQSLLHDKDFGR